MKPSDLSRFYDKFYIGDSTECWLWDAATIPDGYGSFGLGGRQHGAHRIMYQLFNGPIPKGITIDHSCRIYNCVNPLHLRLATYKQNNENVGPKSCNVTGIRGVTYIKYKKKYRVTVRHNGKNYYGGYFFDKYEAEKKAIEMRNTLFTHNMEEL